MTRTHLRIEQIVPALPPAGMEFVVARLSRALARRGHDVGVTCIEHVGTLGERLRAEGIPVTLVPTPGIVSIFLPGQLRDWLRQRAPDVVHVHSGAWLKAARAATLAGVPRIVHTVHGLLDREPWHGPLFKRWAARYTAAITTVSEPLRDYCRDVVGIPADRLFVVPNGIDTDAFAPGRATGVLRTALGISPERFVIGNVARFSPVKNHELLIDAFALLHSRCPQAYLALIGEGELRPVIEDRVRTMGLDRDVGFFGLAADVAPVYRDMDAFVLPSLAEGTSMSVLEAMASGLCVTATAVGGTPDLLAEGEAGLLVPSCDAPALARALERVVGGPELRARVGRAARTRVMERYSEEETVNRFEALYGDLVGPGAIGGSSCVE